MTLRLSQYFNKFSNGIAGESGYELASLLSLRGRHPDGVTQEIIRMPPSRINDQCSSLRDGFSEVVAAHFQVLMQMYQNDIVKAHKGQCSLLNSFLVKVFQNESVWVLPILYAIAKDLLYLSVQADRVLAETGKDEGENEGDEAAGNSRKDISVQEAVRLFHRCFQACNQDRSEPRSSKRLGNMFICNLLFRSYFKMGNLAGTKSAIRSMEAPGTLPIKDYPRAQVVTYNYFLGRIKLLDSDYKA
eukprot:Colp12_sorted_trinity150504_noHs@30869